MRTETVMNPLLSDADVLLVRIETSRDSFTAGRRNNDLVNWFIVKRIIDLNQFEGADRTLTEMDRDYCDDWDHMVCGLTDAQQDDLNNWYEHGRYPKITPVSKIERFVSYYGKIRNPRQLANLWLPMDYEVLSQPENQTTPPTEG